MDMRLDKLLANTGFGSRKEVKQLLKKNMVMVNQTIEKDGKVHVNPENDEVFVNGEKVRYKQFVYFLLHKPQGYVSATEDVREQTVLELLKESDQIYNVHPVGRLDKNTEGLLLLTNDGSLTHRLTSPKYKVPKTYYAHIRGTVFEKHIEAFQQGVVLDDGYQSLPATLTILKSGDISEIELTIVEGKFHQVKRMFEALGMKVIYLKRLSMGPLQLDEDLTIGHYRELTEKEVKELKQD